MLVQSSDIPPNLLGFMSWEAMVAGADWKGNRSAVGPVDGLEGPGGVLGAALSWAQGTTSVLWDFG